MRRARPLRLLFTIGGAGAFLATTTGCYTLLKHPADPTGVASRDAYADGYEDGLVDGFGYRHIPSSVVLSWYGGYGAYCDYYSLPWWAHHDYYPGDPGHSPGAPAMQGPGFGRGGRDEPRPGTTPHSVTPPPAPTRPAPKPAPGATETETEAPQTKEKDAETAGRGGRR